MTKRQPVADHPGIMNRSHQPVSVVFDVEDHKTIYIVCIGEARPQFNKVLPLGWFHNPDPGADFFRSFLKLVSSLLQTLDRDDMHPIRVLRKLLRVKNGS